MQTARRWTSLLVTVALAAIALPGCLVVPGDTSQITLLGSGTILGWQYDTYRNNAYDCAISGKQTFVVARQVGSSDTASAPLWVVMHGDGVGWFDSSGNPQPDSTQMTEESGMSLRNQLGTPGLLQSVSSSSAGFRLLAVSYCDRDDYGGTGGPDVNNPHPAADGSVHKTNGLQATKAAIQFVQTKYPTSKYFLHGEGDGASGAYLAAYALQKMGNAPAGVIGDSGVENFVAGRAAYQQGVCTNPRFGPSGAPAVARRVDESIADSRNEVDQLVSGGDFTVPLLHIWNTNDPTTCGNAPMQCPLRDGSVQTLGATECMHEPLTASIDAARLKIPSQNMPLCVTQSPSPTCGARPVTTASVTNSDLRSPVNFLAAAMDWVNGRLAGVGPPPDTPRVASGVSHACAVRSGGTVWCWGVNTYGELGNGSRVSTTAPVQVVGLTDALGVVAGDYHSCALLDGGAVQCWGDYSVHAVGPVNGPICDFETPCDYPTPVRSGTDSGVAALVAGAQHNCVDETSGAYYCWGFNFDGELGLGTTSLIGSGFVAGITAPRAMTSGPGNSCVVLNDGTAKCWGPNTYGGLGDGTTTDSTSPVTVVGLAGATGIVTSGGHTCAVVAGGAVDCWGLNDSGQLGNGSTTDSLSPVPVSGLAGATRVVAGYEHTCAVVAAGGVECWGANDSAQLGDGTTTPSTTPVSVVGVSGATAIDADGKNACGIAAGSVVKCWGTDSDGQLGNGIGDHGASLPVPVSGISGATGVANGETHTCAVVGGGSVDCWGLNSYGQLGNGTTTNSATPVAVSGIADATAVSAGGSSTCAIVTDGAIKCWGLNSDGQLGNGTTTSSSVPVDVSGLIGAIAVAVGDVDTCAVLGDGTARCWGSGGRGALGNGTTTSSPTPVVVSGIVNATAIGTGDLNSCALLADGTAKCWGIGASGALGNGTTTDSSTPVPVTGLSGAAAIDTAGIHSCASTTAGAVDCWGSNQYGELGNGTTAFSTTPAAVTGLAGATSLSLGFDHSCAVISGGEVRCWGSNETGQLGNESYLNAATPVAVVQLTGATAISTSDNHPISLNGQNSGNTCAVVSGAVECWGDNTWGQLGAVTPLFLTPVDVIGF